jgi:dimethylamine/trimethylamine dehydrogenase
LPGLATWGRVADWRLGQLRDRSNVNLYPGSELTADDVLALEHRQVVVATGARWTKMLFSTLEFPVGELEVAGVYTPDDLASGFVPPGPVVVFDFDNYYMGGAVAELLAKQAGDVTYVTTAGNVSAWTIMTNELPLVHRALVAAGVAIHTLRRVCAFDGESVSIADVYTGAELELRCRSLVIVGMRKPREELYDALVSRSAELDAAGIAAVTRIGDALAPGAIVHAVHSGHRFAREIDTAAGAAAGTLMGAALRAPGAAAAGEAAPPYLRDFPL